MDDNRWPENNVKWTSPAPSVRPAAAVDTAGDFLRRLIPFPAAADLASGHIPLMPSLPAAAAPQAVSPQAASIVAEAASILDEEMAKGALAARHARPMPSSSTANPTGSVLRQVHDVIDNLAQMWPSLGEASAQWPVPAIPMSAGDGAGLPSLAPASVVRPGERGSISMMLRNREDRPVWLTPIATDLVGCSGGRIDAQFVEFTPREVKLDPGEQMEIRGRIAVPVDAAVGSYVGLLVVTGVDHLRALVTVEVG